MKKYKVVPLKLAHDDMANILSYLSNNLLNEFAAQKYAKLFESALKNLAYFPNGGTLLENQLYRNEKIRIIHIKRYVMFYVVDEEKSEVRILRVGHVLMNQDKLLND